MNPTEVIKSSSWGMTLMKWDLGNCLQPLMSLGVNQKQVLSPKSHFGNFSGVLVPSHWGLPYWLCFWPESAKEGAGHVNAEQEKLVVGDPSAWAKNISWGFIALSCFSVFLTFLYIVLFNIANLAVEREGKTVVVCQAYLPNTVLSQVGRCSPGILRWHHGLAVPCVPLLLLPSLWPAALPVPGNKSGGWAHLGLHLLAYRSSAPGCPAQH